MSTFDLTIISYAKKREDWLCNCCIQVQSQRTNLRVQHIVFYEDCGYGGMKRGIERHQLQCRGRVDVTPMEVPSMSELSLRDWGACFALGDYICYWNYGNYWTPDAADSLYAAASGYDVGICQCTCWFNQDYRTVPQWSGHVKRGDIYYGSCCFRREAARAVKWEGYDYICAEHRVIRGIEEGGGSVNFCPLVVGTIQGHY